MKKKLTPTDQLFEAQTNAIHELQIDLHDLSEVVANLADLLGLLSRVADDRNKIRAIVEAHASRN